MGRQICKFRVREGCDDGFVRMNMHDWPDFFSRSSDYRGTTIGRNADDPRVYVTMDEWTSKSAFDGYVKENGKEWDALSARHKDFFESFENVGFYDF